MLKIQRFTDIPGAMSVREGKELARLAKGNLVLEIGSLYGRSTVPMARTAKMLHSVDWHKGDKHIGARDSLNVFLNNLIIHNVRHKVVVHVCKIEDMEEILATQCFDFAFIDGLHTYDSTRYFIQLAKRCVKPGRFVAIHDYYNDLAKDFRSKDGVDAEFEMLETVIDSLAVARIPATASDVVTP